MLHSSDYDWNHAPLLYEHYVIKVVHNNPSALQTLGYYLRKLVHMNLWPSLTIQCVTVAALCIMAFWFICVFLLVLPAFPLFIYKNPFPKHVLIRSESTMLLSIGVL